MRYLKICFLLFITGPFVYATDYPAGSHKEEMKQFQQRRNRVEQVLIHLENIPGGSTVYPGSNGLIELERRRFRSSAKTLDAMASFYNVRANNGYTVKGYHQSPSQAFEQPMELWGIWKNIEISEQQNEHTFVRNMPYIIDVQPIYTQNRLNNPALIKGEEVLFNIVIHNPAHQDFKARVVLLLKNETSGKIKRLERDVILAARGYRESASLYYVADEPGEYHIAAGIFIKQRINQWTDCWDWSENPMIFVTNEHRTLEFAGYRWDVKSGFGNPGANLWSNDTSNVWVDDRGRLHLSLTQKANERWYATEVISKQTFGYGTYTFFIDAEPFYYDPHVVAGIFLYRDEANEIDIEFSRWGDKDNYQFGNYVIQPAERPGNQFRFPIITSGSFTTHRIEWKPNEVHFSSWHGHYPDPPEDKIIAQWHYTGRYIPNPTGLHLFFNLWLFRGIPPKEAKDEKLIINHFTYFPLTDE